MASLARRDLLALAGGALAAELLSSTDRAVAAEGPIRAAAFDAFVIFDPGSLATEADRLYPGHGTELALAWRTSQFEYCWLRSLAGRWADFEQITADALAFAAEMLHLDLPTEKRDTLMHAVVRLPAYPDVTPALRALKDRGVRLAFLSNLTARMLRARIAWRSTVSD